jgi:hypothetical protein
MMRIHKSDRRTNKSIGGMLLLVGTVSLGAITRPPQSAPTIVDRGSRQPTNVPIDQGPQRRQPASSSVNNEHQETLRAKQSDALKRLNRLVDSASLIGDAS